MCVEHCLKFHECIAVTHVEPNPDLYDSSWHGCYLKSGTWTVSTEAIAAKMVSVDVACIRNECELNHTLSIMASKAKKNGNAIISCRYKDMYDYRR